VIKEEKINKEIMGYCHLILIVKNIKPIKAMEIQLMKEMKIG
jgi:hypothetical protein